MAIVFSDNIEILQRKVYEGGEVARKIRMTATRTDDVTGSVVSKHDIKWVTGNDVPVIEAMAVGLANAILADLPEKVADDEAIAGYKTRLHTYLTERSDLQ